MDAILGKFRARFMIPIRPVATPILPPFPATHKPKPCSRFVLDSAMRYMFLLGLGGGGGMALDNRIKTRINANVARIRAEARAGAPIDPHMRIKKRVAEVAYLMALIHGGDWRVEIDPHSTFVLISRRQKRTSRSRG